jgi:N-acetylmuramoyl-L-alanine amidase
MYYVSSTLQASDVKVLLKNNAFSVSSISLAEQSNLSHLDEWLKPTIGKKKNFRIVIDAGHGGHDPGAVGKNSKEKDLVLKMALKVGEMIQKNYPDVEVFQTRTTDVFIPLFRRIQYANEQNADLFLSIHCNYISNAKTRGTETFVMGLHRAGENLEVAKRENASILLEANYEANYDGYDPKSAEGHIMMSMFQNAYLDKSIEFAADVESQFSAMHISKSRGVKQAGFAVLRRASMPAVLIEAGFLSNEIEEAFLISDEGQQVIAESLLKAFSNFYKNNQNIKQINDKVKDESLTSLNAKENQIKGTTKPNSSISNTSVTPSKAKVADFASTSETGKSGLSLYYKVQIAAFKNESADIDTPELRKIGKLSLFKQNDINKYLVGDFISRESAEIAREKLKNLGYKGAFIVVLNN